MALYTRYANIPASRFVQPTSRYANSKTIFYTEDKKITFDTYKRKPYVGEGSWLEITSSVEYRPDLVSFEFYGAPDFWWKIMEVNGMMDVLQFKQGINIFLPSNIF
jgi:hypothetical protein